MNKQVAFDQNDCYSTMIATKCPIFPPSDRINKMIDNESYDDLSSCLRVTGSHLVLRGICARGNVALYDDMIRRGYVPDEMCLTNSIGKSLFYDILKSVTPDTNCLFHAILCGEGENVKAMINRGVNVNAFNQYTKLTPLQKAKELNDAVIIKLLTDAGAK